MTAVSQIFLKLLVKFNVIYTYSLLLLSCYILHINPWVLNVAVIRFPLLLALQYWLDPLGIYVKLGASVFVSCSCCRAASGTDMWSFRWVDFVSSQPQLSEHLISFPDVGIAYPKPHVSWWKATSQHPNSSCMSVVSQMVVSPDPSYADAAGSQILSVLIPIVHSPTILFGPTQPGEQLCTPVDCNHTFNKVQTLAWGRALFQVCMVLVYCNSPQVLFRVLFTC